MKSLDERIGCVDEWLREGGNGDVADLIRDLRDRVATLTEALEQRGKVIIKLQTRIARWRRRHKAILSRQA